MHGASSLRKPPGDAIPVAASYLDAGNHFRKLGPTGRAVCARCRLGTSTRLKESGEAARRTDTACTASPFDADLPGASYPSQPRTSTQEPLSEIRLDCEDRHGSRRPARRRPAGRPDSAFPGPFGPRGRLNRGRSRSRRSRSRHCSDRTAPTAAPPEASRARRSRFPRADKPSLVPRPREEPRLSAPSTGARAARFLRTQDRRRPPHGPVGSPPEA